MAERSASDLATAFAGTVRSHGPRPALVSGTESLSFTELADQAAGVSRALLEHASAPGAPIAVLSHNSAAAVVGALGVAGAGCATVALDPSHPPARLRALLRRAQAPIVLHGAAQAELATGLAGAVGASALSVESCCVGAPGPYPARQPRPEDLALINFTSGTTGLPKGSAEAFADAIGRYWLYADMLALKPGDRLGLVHYFGGCRIEVYGALLSGACVCVYDLVGTGLGGLADWLDDHVIDVVRLFPTTWRSLAGTLGDRRLESLRRLVLLGEPARADDVRQARRHLPDDATVFSLYASNEASTVTCYRIDPGHAVAEGLLPAGWPLASKTVSIVDPAGKPVPVGTDGEIVVGAARIFRGYFGQPDLTADVLTTDCRGWQRFRTGDRGRLDASGCLHVLGRGDSMVKLRGHRIDLSEVEGAIDTCPGVQQSAVAIATRHDGGEQMMAHVLRQPGSQLGTVALRRHLAESLPGYMLPGVIEMLDEAPLTANGKLARQQLQSRAPVTRRAAGGAAPATPLEHALAEIWCEMLDLETVSVDADFFDLGGDSLLAAMAVVELEGLADTRLTLAAFAECATIRAVAAALENNTAATVEPPILSVHAGGDSAALFGVAGLRGHGLRLVTLGRQLPPLHPIHVLQPPGLSWEDPPRHTIEAMAAYYVAQIRELQPRGPYRLLGASFGAVVAYEMTCQLEAAGETVAWLCLLDGDAPRSALSPEMQTLALPPVDATNPDPDALARRHRDALMRYVPGRRITAQVHFGLCVESLVEPHDRRDWRAFVDGPVSMYLLPGLHGAFHAEPQRTVVVRLASALLEAGTAAHPFPAAPLFQRFEHDGDTLNGEFGRSYPLKPAAKGVAAIERRDGKRGVRLEGWCLGAAGGTQPGRVLLFDAERYLGWGAILRPARPPGQAVPSACGFRLDVRGPAGRSAALWAVALDEAGGTALVLPPLSAPV